MQMKCFTWTPQKLFSLPEANQIARGIEDVKLFMSLLDGTWISSFKGKEQDLFCLLIYQQPRNSCRRQTNLLQAEVIGIIRRYVMTRLSLTHQKWWKQARSSKEVVIKSDHVKFAQMLIAENWTLKMNNILCHPLGPWALALVDGPIAEEN